MAATSVGRVLTLCRQIQSGFRISSLSLSAQHSTFTATKPQSSVLRPAAPLLSPDLTCHVGIVGQYRPLHTSITRRGLDEFFDTPENWGETSVKSGAPWTAKQLRTKSNEDLHKLWYVLLKEKNMLLTLEQEAKRQRMQMPSPERLKKIDRSMKRLDTVVKEREDALRLLQTGQEKGRPGAWRKNIFGKVYWQRFREYAIPWYMNKRYKIRRFHASPFVTPHLRLRLEKFLRSRTRKENLGRRQEAVLQEKFPQMKVRSS